MLDNYFMIFILSNFVYSTQKGHLLARNTHFWVPRGSLSLNYLILNPVPCLSLFLFPSPAIAFCSLPCLFHLSSNFPVLSYPLLSFSFPLLSPISHQSHPQLSIPVNWVLFLLSWCENKVVFMYQWYFGIYVHCNIITVTELVDPSIISHS